MAVQGMPRVLYLGTPEHSSDIIRRKYARDLDIDILDATSREDLLEQLPKLIATRGPYTGIVCRLGTQHFEPFDAQLFSQFLPQLRIVVSAQSGYDDFDVEWMTSKDVWFCNTRDSTGESTANMAIFLILAVLRDTTRAESNFREGRWRSGLKLGRDPSGLTIGIVGMGSIGMSLAHKATALGMKVVYHTRSGTSVRGAPERSIGCETLEQLLRISDVVSLNCPLTNTTKHLIGREEINLMKNGSYIINTSRGAVVESAALIEALESGKIKRAGLDVFENEPNISHYLMRSDKIVAQPHMGGLTEESFERAEDECLQNMRLYCETGFPRASVNDVRIIVRNDSPMLEGHLKLL